MNKARLALEIYRHFLPILPSRFRYPLKRYIDSTREEWYQIGILQSSLDDTPYQILLDMKHWHQRWTYVKGYYPEPHITAILNEYLKPGNIFIDIGANIGVHTVYAAHKVGDTGQCIAFEPNPHSYERLNEQIVLNNLQNVITHHTALGNESGTVILHGCNDENVGSSLRDSQSDEFDCEVSLNKADSFLGSIPGEQGGICKIDVEGYESQVLLGLQEFVSSHPNMVYIVEVTDEWLKASGSSAEILFKFFREFGFQPYLIQADSGSLRQLKQALAEWQYDTLFKR